MTRQQAESILLFWASPDSYDLRNGYERISDYYQNPIGAAKTRVHKAIGVMGGYGHSDLGVRTAWKYWRKQAKRVTDMN